MTTLIVAADLAGALPDLTAAALAGLPAVVTAAAERYCGRPLALAALDQESAPGTPRLIRLRGRPVVSVDRVLTDLATVLAVAHAPGPWRASVALRFPAGSATPDGLVLTTEAGPVAIPFAPASPAPALVTVADLAAAVNATAGWAATVAPGMGGCPLADLRPARGALDALAAPARLEAYASAVGDYELDPRSGRITLRQVRPDPYAYPARTFGALGGAALVRVLYSAGYNGDPQAGPVTTPPDLAEACVEIARAVVDTRQVSRAYTSVNLGNTTFGIGTPAPIPEGARMLLAPYVDRRPA